MIPSVAIEAWMVQLIFAMTRIGGTLVTAPIFSAIGVPLQVRVVLAASIGVLVLGVYPIDAPADPLSLQGFAIIAQEALIGLSLGFIIQLAFAAPLLAGEYLANSIGLGFANMVDPQSGNHSAVVGQFLNILMTLIFLSMNGHLMLVQLVVKSYELMPLGGGWLTRGHFWEIIMFGGYVFAGGLAIALPVGFALFGLNLLVGVITRAAPQLNIFAVGLPLTLMTGFIVLAIAFPAMSQLMQQAGVAGLDQARQWIGM